MRCAWRVAIVLGLGLFAASCSSFSGFVADSWPRWAGGLPPGVPPRPGAPGYQEYIAHQQAQREAVKPPAEQQGAPAAAAGPPDAVPGGLY